MSIRRILHASTLACAAFTASANAQPVVAFEAPRLLVAGPVEAPVRLQAVRVRAQVSGHSALTEVELTFHNPNGRQLEGELQFPLQEGQSVVGMAMAVGGRLREAVPVEKARGEAVFEAITRANVDPALLSQTQGNNYKLRVYPLPPRADKVVLLRYVESLPGAAARYRLPLNYAVTVPELSVRIEVAGAASPRASLRGVPLPGFVGTADGVRLDFQRRDFAPADVLELALAQTAEASVTTERREGRTFFVAESAVTESSAPRALPRRVALVWDASRSGAERDHGRELALLGAYFANARDTEVSLTLVRDAAEPAQRFPVVKGDWQSLRRVLENTVYDGATSLGAYVPDPNAGEVLLFSDGLSNFGVERFPSSKVPVYAISAAVRNDAARLRALAEDSGGRFIDLQGGVAQAARRLLEASTRVVAVESDGATQLVLAAPVDLQGRVTVGGQLTESRAPVRVILQHPNGRRETLTLDVDGTRHAGTMAAQAWARMKIAALDAEFDAHRAEILRLGNEFSIVTRETSLIILDRAEDYARHEISPPPELAAEVARLREQLRSAARADANAQLERVVTLFKAKQAWWETEFPRGPLPTPPVLKDGAAAGALQAEPRGDSRRNALSRPMPLGVAAAPAPSVMREMAKSTGPAPGASPLQATIRLRPISNDAPYAARLRAASDAQLYPVYLDERASHPDSTAFLLDVADLLFERRQNALALRVLSNLAEMNLENRQLLRLLGARLVQAGRADLAVPILRKVLVLAPEEPQSQRDLGLALAANGQAQAAVDALYEVARRQWDRFPEVELIALAELNAIVATADSPIDTSRIDPRLVKNMPLDLRATMTWDADNTDIDLWVTDPNGERAYYGHPLSHQGGRVSRDITSGYGPEEFSLRHAKPGKYTVTTQFYGQRQQLLSAAMTVQLSLITGFGTRHQQVQTVTLRLKEPKDQVLVGEFEVADPEDRRSFPCSSMVR